MPTVSVGRDRLFAALRRTYTREEFEDLCFSFGIELDDVTSEKEIIKKERHLEEEEEAEEPVASKEVIYKIEVPANRYDLLCLEGIAQALQIFNRQEEVPNYTVAAIPKESMLRMHVRAETSQIRPYIVCAVLRGITFDEASYNSFIDLQDKLHQNICRRRTLVAVGTHDLDTLEGPFTYEALPPPSINFVPLKQVKNFRADELMEFYKSDLKLKKFLHIIENSPVFPVLYDSRRTVLSLPPVINGAHSAITLKTKNVFIECTATDLRKANIVLNTLVTAFSTYCERKFEVEPVEVIYADGKSYICPDLSIYRMDVPVSYITDSIGVSLEAEEVTSLLQRMQLSAEESVSPDGKSKITVSIPPTRSDVLHPCDVMEDVAIAYGYNNIPKRKPASLKPLPLNQLSDLIRLEIATNGFTEVLTWILCSYKENFDMLNRKDDKSTAVIIGNPRSADFEVVRTSLMPGILKTVGQNKDHPKPIKIFEVGDVTLLDDSKDVGATNRRQLAALYCGTNSGFELIHGLVDRIMEVIGTPFVTVGDDSGYYIQLSDEPEFLPGRQASIIYKGKHFGNFGIVHPEVLNNFDIPDPCSFVELNIESFL
ncbi:phenylalanine--tRNA ligase beta subunit, cytoplasmic [Punica granatum]|uniref:phenylalanine--tRNA ligase n=1 Tax=Punica granatum TaxID=22663 RepID=A0A6P8E9L8_PUNGR|nr:phenylalanine--tRNA ligase beta subunit, cytoplasmic [Punica granatum]